MPKKRTSQGCRLRVVLVTAIGSTVDAIAIGVSLAFLQDSILVIASAIGAATFLMAFGGILVRHLIGERFGRIAEAAAGLALAGLDASIPDEHLSRLDLRSRGGPTE